MGGLVSIDSQNCPVMIFCQCPSFNKETGEGFFRGTVKLVEGSLHGLTSRHRCRVEGSITAAADTCSSTMRVGGGGGGGGGGAGRYPPPL